MFLGHGPDPKSYHGGVESATKAPWALTPINIDIYIYIERERERLQERGRLHERDIL